MGTQETSGQFSRRNQRNFAILIGLFACYLLTHMVSFQAREILPDGIEKVADFSKQVPIPISPNQIFKTAISGDLQLLQRKINIDDLISPDMLRVIHEAANKKPNLVIERIGFTLATYNQSLKCSSISLILNGHIESKPLPCPSITDNQISYFEFETKIKPGIYRVEFKGDVQSPFAAYGFLGPDSLGWLPGAYTKAPTALAILLWHWLKSHTSRGIFYLLLAMVTAFLFIKGRATKINFIILIFGIALSFALIMPQYSGHDETAHITMMHRTFFPEKNADSFHIATRESMISNDFYRMHGARLLAAGECPHKILGNSCGTSPGPEMLYSLYAKAMAGLGIKPPETPRGFLNLGRGINLGWIAVTTLLLGLLFGETALLLMLFYLLFIGTFLGQAASISNDPPMYLFGFSIAAGLTHIMARPAIKNLIFLPISLGLYLLAKQVDRSAVAALPLLISSLLFIPLAQLRREKPKGFTGFLLFFSFFLIVLICGLNWMKLSELLQLDVIGLVGMITDDASMLTNIGKFSFLQAVQAFRVYGESAIGSFIWGHSLLPTGYSVAIGISAALLALIGIGWMATSSGSALNTVGVALLGVLVASQCLIILAAQMALSSDLPILFEAFLKPRLTAPGIGAFLIAPSLGLLVLNANPKFKIGLFKLLSLWTLIWQLYLLPYVSLKDLY